MQLNSYILRLIPFIVMPFELNSEHNSIFQSRREKGDKPNFLCGKNYFERFKTYKEKNS